MQGYKGGNMDKKKEKLMQEAIDKITKLLYPKYLLEMALYGYIDIKEFVKKYPVESLLNKGGNDGSKLVI